MLSSPDKAPLFKPIWRCIYCGSNQHRLGKEHIVPFGLGGRVVLPRSSCISEDPKKEPRCSEITKDIERQCLRRMLGPLRIRLDMPTYRPEERPKTLKVRVGQEDENKCFVYTGELEVPSEDFPRVLVLPTFPGLPRIMTGASTTPDWAGGLFSNINKDDVIAFHDKYNCWPEIAAVHPLYFFRLIAKIAHSWTVAAEGFDTFRPFYPISSWAAPRASAIILVAFLRPYNRNINTV